MKGSFEKELKEGREETGGLAACSKRRLPNTKVDRGLCISIYAKSKKSQHSFPVAPLKFPSSIVSPGQLTMAQRDLITQPITNTERFLNTKYSNAHALLQTDADTAETLLLELLQEPRLPLWKRAQCNMILASISEDYATARAYLVDARDVLDLYHAATPEDASQVEAMKHDIAQVAEDVELLRNISSEASAIPPAEPRSDASKEVLSPHHHTEHASQDLDPEALEEEEEEEEEMLLGYHGDPQEVSFTGRTQAEASVGQSESVRGRTRSPEAMEVDSSQQTQTTRATSYSGDGSAKQEDSDSDTTMLGASSEDEVTERPGGTAS